MAAFLNCAFVSPPRHKLEGRCIRTPAPPIVRAQTCSVISVRDCPSMHASPAGRPGTDDIDDDVTRYRRRLTLMSRLIERVGLLRRSSAVLTPSVRGVTGPPSGEVS